MQHGGGHGGHWHSGGHRGHWHGGGWGPGIALGWGGYGYDDGYGYGAYAYGDQCETIRVRYVRPNGRVAYRLEERCY